MKSIGLTILLGLACNCSVIAQDQPDSEFTTTILAQENMVRYRVFASKFIRSAEGIEELEITPQQTALIEEAISSGNTRVAELSESMNHSQSGEVFKALSKQHTAAMHQLRSDVLANLTSEQRKRFAQVAFQKHLSSSRSLEMYLHRSIQPFINLSESQRSELQRVVSDANAEYLEEFAALNEKYRQKVLDGVDRSIREKVDSVVGEPWFRFRARGKSVLSNDVGNKK